jgi:hypothetical protein
VPNPEELARDEAKHLLGWEGQKLTADQFKALQSAALLLWYPDKRQAYAPPRLGYDS